MTEPIPTRVDLGAAPVKTAASPLSYAMKGRLTLSNTGWVLLAVPNAIGNGAFQALTEQGIEQPTSESNGKYNAHISVMTPAEVQEIGGPENIKQQRGQTYSFNLGPVREIQNPSGWSEMSKVWVIEVKSPELLQLRRSLGLGAPRFPFHITFAVRRKGALRKSASIIHFMKTAAQATEIKESPIDGKGLFATSNFKDGDVIISRYMTKFPANEEGKTRWEQSEESRFTNHSPTANVEVVPGDGYAKLVAARDITSGEELLGNYEHAVEALGPDFYYTYRGRPYHGESTSKQTYGVEHPVSRSLLYVLRGTSYLGDDTSGGDGDNSYPQDGEGRTADPATADDTDSSDVQADHSRPAESAAAVDRADASVESVVRSSEDDTSRQRGRGGAEDVAAGHQGGDVGKFADGGPEACGGGHRKMGSGHTGPGHYAGGDARLRESFTAVLRRICGDDASGSHPGTTSKCGSVRRGAGNGTEELSVLGPSLHRPVQLDRRSKHAAAGAAGSAGNGDASRCTGNHLLTECGLGGILKLGIEIKPPPNQQLPAAAEEADKEEKRLERAVNRNLRERQARRIAGVLDKIAASAVSTDAFFSSPPNKEGRKCPGCGRLFKECEPLPDVKMCEVCERFGPPTKEAADNTIQAYKQFRTLESRPGQLFPLFINRTEPVPEGEWLDAENIPTEGFAPRPGWHAGALPSAPHLRSKEDRIQPNRIWAEVELPADVDWQSVADASPTGDVRNEVPAGGYYRKKTPQMQGGEWLIGGGLKVRRQLSDDDVSEILRRAGEHEAAQRERKTLEKEGASLAQQIAAARHKTKEPKSEAPAEAGNYPKGKVNMHGMTISLENPKGSTRSGTDPNGKTWSITLQHDYGYILGSEGRDGDHVDVFIGPDLESEFVAVVDQVDPNTLKFDEVKVMLGFVNLAAAKRAYLDNYEEGWKGMGEVTPISMAQFKEWITSGDTKKSYGTYARKARQAKSAGVRRVVDNETAVSQPECPEVRVLRSSRDSCMQKVAHELLGVLRRHGAATGRYDAGENRQQWGLRARKLPVGNVGGTATQQEKQSVLHVSGENYDPAGLVTGAGNTVVYSAAKAAGLPVDTGTCIFSSSELARKIKQSAANIPRAYADCQRVGNGDRDFVPNLEDSVERVAVVDSEGTVNSRCKVATDSFYLNAVRATPMGWNSQQSVARNLMSNLQRVKARGDRAITEAESLDRLQNAMDPNRSIRQLQSYLAGTRQPIVHHPLDRFLREGTL